MWFIQCSSCISTLSTQRYAVQKNKPHFLTFDESLQEVSQDMLLRPPSVDQFDFTKKVKL